MDTTIEMLMGATDRILSESSKLCDDRAKSPKAHTRGERDGYGVQDQD